MGSGPRLDDHRLLQEAARTVLETLGPTIRAGDTERSIVDRAVNMMAQAGITETWYYDCPALVLLGARSCLSISGRDYRPAEVPLGGYDLVTVDLSPSRGEVWGDCARTFCVHDGSVGAPSSREFREGVAALVAVHEAVARYVDPATIFGEIHRELTGLIESVGFQNLDFRGNLGHSIERSLDTRRFIDGKSSVRLDEVELFAVEPHIRARGGDWGFKHEEIYFLDRAGAIRRL
jgi:Xaa-Pro aminopeptidase